LVHALLVFAATEAIDHPCPRYRNQRRTFAEVSSMPNLAEYDHLAALSFSSQAGRPRRLTEKDTAAAKALLADGSLTSKDLG
jgi:hypothetical protein